MQEWTESKANLDLGVKDLGPVDEPWAVVSHEVAIISYKVSSRMPNRSAWPSVVGTCIAYTCQSSTFSS